MRVLVFAGGDPVTAERTAALPVEAYVIAADSGASHARAAGRAVDLLVGDLDSIDPALALELEARGTRVERFPAAKDRTDLALALDAALALEPSGVTVVGGHGGRLDHLVANALLLASDDYAGVALDAWMGEATVTVVRGRRELRGAVGDLVSLLPIGGPAGGVSTEGLMFPLSGATLRPGTTWGVSNQLVATAAAVTVTTGVVLAVQPGQRGAL
jgi:thiamine pyrophosphokinase